MAKAPSFATKVQMYHRLLHGGLTQELAPAYQITRPTFLKYVTEVIATLSELNEVRADVDLKVFLAKGQKVQAFEYEDAVSIQGRLEPILAPYLAEANAISTDDRESADCPIATRVTKTTERKIKAIVQEMSRERPDLTVASLLREVIEEYVEKSVVPAPTVNIANPIQLRQAMNDAITDVLNQFGIDGL